MTKRSRYIVKHPVDHEPAGRYNFGKAGFKVIRYILGIKVVTYYNEEA